MREQLAIWNINETAEMSAESNLRNTCKQIEDEYVTWGRYVSVTCQRQWPMIGELGRYHVPGMVLGFNKHRRYVDVVDSTNKVMGRVHVKPGMAVELYKLAGTVADRAEVEVGQ
jgi:hypothetical protein